MTFRMRGTSATAKSTSEPGRILVLDGKPPPPLAWLRTMASFWPVQVALARKDFKSRYKAASLGVAWSIVIPLLQATVIAVIFSQAFRGSQRVENYGTFVASGMLSFTYLSSSVVPATTSIVDGSGLTDKVWFPRILLVLATPLANLIGLAVTYIVLVSGLWLLDVDYSMRLLVLPAGLVLLFIFTAALSAVLAAMNVYFRDTKFLVQAAFLVWMYVTPILYPADVLGRFGGWLEANPMTGIVTVVRLGIVGADDWQRPVIVSVVATIVLCIAAFEAHRRHDRRFVDLL